MKLHACLGLIWGRGGTYRLCVISVSSQDQWRMEGRDEIARAPGAKILRIVLIYWASAELGPSRTTRCARDEFGRRQKERVQAGAYPELTRAG